MTWLITGASGQLGTVMQHHLDSRGVSYVALSSQELDITNQTSVEKILTASKPDVVINCAAWTDVDGAEKNKTKAHEINALGPKYLAIASKRVGAKLVHISSDYVFSGENQKPWQENSEMNPVSIYGESKRDGEKYLQVSYPEGSYIVRTAWLYSAVGKNFAKTILNLALTGDGDIKVVADQIGQPTSANDLARQISDLVLSNSPYGTYHGTNSGQATWFEFAQKIFRFVNANPKRIVPVSSNEFPRIAKRPHYSVLGHESWQMSGIAAMRNWELALDEELANIVDNLGQDLNK
jgi:dTDP-4-dehydrorhamnose reductase